RSRLPQRGAGAQLGEQPLASCPLSTVIVGLVARAPEALLGDLGACGANASSHLARWPDLAPSTRRGLKDTCKSPGVSPKIPCRSVLCMGSDLLAAVSPPGSMTDTQLSRVQSMLFLGAEDI